MVLIETSRELQKVLNKYRIAGKTIGFTPTMGALHSGHISLIDASTAKADITVCSIFVNPTQFNQSSDLKKYPRTLDSDQALLTNADCDVLFFPSVDEVYPKDLDTDVKLDLKGLDRKMEGEFRPGHFKGVAQVVKRLLDLVQPDYIFMGQKDFQQFSIIDYMLNKLKIPTQLVVCPTARDGDGLAMSSRNLRLLPHIRERAGIIHNTLTWAKEKLDTLSVKQIENEAMERMNITDFRPEYFEIINGRTLKPITYAGNCHYVVACTAVWAGEVRLIDNMILFKK